MSGDDGEYLPVEPEVSEDLVRELLRIEDARIGRDHRQADIQEKALDVSNEQDKRQAEFHGKRIEYEDEADQRRISLLNKLLSWGGLVIAAPLALFLYMVFFGDESQSENAMAIVKTLGVGLAGYGSIYAVGRVARALLKKGRNS